MTRHGVSATLIILGGIFITLMLIFLFGIYFNPGLLMMKIYFYVSFGLAMVCMWIGTILGR